MYVAEHLSQSAVCLLQRTKARVLGMCMELLAFASRQFAPSMRQASFTLLGLYSCLLYTSPSPRDRQKSRMPSSA